MISSNFLKKKNHFVHVAFVKTIIEIMIVSIKKKSKRKWRKKSKKFWWMTSMTWTKRLYKTTLIQKIISV